MFLIYKENYLRPERPPFRIVLSDGTKRTDPESFTKEELIDAGYEIAPPKPSIIPWGMEVDWDRDAKRWVVFGEYAKQPDNFDYFRQNKKIYEFLIEESEAIRLSLIEQDADMTEFNQYVDALNNVNLSTQDVTWPSYEHEFN